MSHKWTICLAIASHLFVSRPMEAKEKKSFAYHPVADSVELKAGDEGSMTMSRHDTRYDWNNMTVRRWGFCQPEDRGQWELNRGRSFETFLPASKRIKLFYQCCRCGQVLTDWLNEALGPDLASVILLCRAAGFERFMKRRWMN